MNRKVLVVLLFCTITLISFNSVYADTYALNVNAVCKVQTTVVHCVPPFPGNAVNSSGQITAGSSVSLQVTTPSYVGMAPQTRYVLDGYLLWKNGIQQTPQPVNSNSFTLTMDANYNLTWAWHEELNLTLTSNYGSPQQTGEGWVSAGGVVQISTPQIFFVGSSQYYFQSWLVTGNATIANANSPTTTVTLATPVAIQAKYNLVQSNMTNTYTTTITTIINSSTITTTSTGIFSHSTVNVQLQIKNSAMSPSLLANANVTVLDDAGVRVFKGLTDNSGLTVQFPANPTLIYTVQIKYLTNTFSTRQQFPTSNTYPIDIAGQQPLLTIQQIEPYIILIVVVIIIVAALVIYALSRRSPSRPHTEWVSR